MEAKNEIATAIIAITGVSIYKSFISFVFADSFLTINNRKIIKAKQDHIVNQKISSIQPLSYLPTALPIKTTNIPTIILKATLSVFNISFISSIFAISHYFK